MQAFNLVAFILATSSALKFPAYLTKCKIQDEGFEKCVLDAAQAGLKLFEKAHPDLHIPSFDPFEISEFKVPAGSVNVVNVQQNYKDCKLYGVHTISLSEFEFEFREKKLRIKGSIPKLQKDCTYEFNGKILILPIVGEGPSHIVLTNVDVELLFDIEEIQNKGKTYIKINSAKLTLGPKHVTYQFNNLFNGQKDLGDNINKVMNDNWLEIWSDIKTGYEKVIAILLQENFNSFFSRVPKEELFY